MIKKEQLDQIEKLLAKNGLKYSQRSKIIKELKEILNYNSDECVLLNKNINCN